MTAHTRVLVTGFGPFLHHDANPSEHLARALDGRRRRGVRFEAAILPVRYEEAARRAQQSGRRRAAVLALGLAGKATRVRVERRGRNLCTSHQPDDRGDVRLGRALIGGAPAALLGLDPGPMHEALHARGITSEGSSDAGGYVCNDLYYRLLHAGVPTLFVHVPPDIRVDAAADALAEGFTRALGRRTGCWSGSGPRWTGSASA